MPVEEKVPADVTLTVDGFGFMTNTLDKNTNGEENSHHSNSLSGSLDKNLVKRYTWKTKNHLTVQVITYGATIISIEAPNRKGYPEEILAGFDSLEDYLRNGNLYFGACIGRSVSYIKDAAIQIRPSGRVYMLSMNKGRHHYNGGYVGFDKVNWNSHVEDLKVIMSHISEDGAEGYPGSLFTQVTFYVTVDNILHIEMKCIATKSTIANISFLPCFNLAGHHAGSEELYKHIFTINADKFVPTDEEHIFVGNKKPVGGTLYDFRCPRRLSDVIAKVPLGGYDINLCVTKGSAQCIAFVCRVVHPDSGRVLEIYSTLPGANFHTGNFLPSPSMLMVEQPDFQGSEEEGDETNKDIFTEYSGEQLNKDGTNDNNESLTGKQGFPYLKHGVFCISPQIIPEAVNNPCEMTAVLTPGAKYNHKIEYRFGIVLGKYI